jgi:hypothetical protein
VRPGYIGAVALPRKERMPDNPNKQDLSKEKLILGASNEIEGDQPLSSEAKVKLPAEAEAANQPPAVSNEAAAPPPAPPPSVEPPPATAPPPAPPTSPAVPEEKQTSGRKPWKFVVLFLAIAAIAGGGFLAANFINTPKKVKEKAELVQSAYLSYEQVVDKVIEDMKDESGASDSESVRRSVEKSRGLLKEVREKRSSLGNLVNTPAPKQMEPYINKINEYITKSDQVIKLEQENVKLGDVWVDILKKYEEINVSLAGVSNYLYSDPAKYVEGLGKAIKDEKEMIDSLKSVKSVDPTVDKLNRALLATFETEEKFLEEMKQAVEKRSVFQITAAQKKYASDSQTASKELNRATDAVKNKVDDLKDELGKINKEVENEYQGLRSRYRF